VREELRWSAATLVLAALTSVLVLLIIGV